MFQGSYRNCQNHLTFKKHNKSIAKFITLTYYKMQHSYTPEKVVKWVTLEGVFFPANFLLLVQGSNRTYRQCCSILKSTRRCCEITLICCFYSCWAVHGSSSAPQVIVRMITLVQELLPDRLRNTAFKKQPESDPSPGSTRNTNTAFLKLPRG